MNRNRLVKHRVTNVLQSLLLLGGLGVLMGVLGWIVGGVITAGVAVLTVLVLYWLNPVVSPRWVLRLYRARSIPRWEAPALTAIVQELARRADLPRVPDLYYLPSDAMNAFAVGNRRGAAIALSGGLLRRLDVREVAAVIAHEISHIRHDDVRLMGFADIAGRMTHALAMLGVLLVLVNVPLVAMGAVTVSWAAIFVLVSAPVISALLQFALSRTREYHADAGAADLTSDPAALASALTKMERIQGRILERIFAPQGRVAEPSLLHSHPPTAQRINRLLALSTRRSAGPVRWIRQGEGSHALGAREPKDSPWRHGGV